MYPSFLCIGTPKSGTTWLDVQFRRHPELWLPPVKELHHFDCSATTPWGLYYRYEQGIQYNLRRAAKQCLTDTLTGQFNQAWYFRYFLLRRTDQWYSKLFSPKEKQIAGEITPAYCRLEESSVQNIKRLMPDLKVILLLRNPVERFWSNLAMYFSKYGYNGIDSVSESEIAAMFESTSHRRSAEYTKTIELWRRHYSQDQMFIGFFEQVESQPQYLLESIYDFLGVQKVQVIDHEKLKKKVNHRRYPSMPEHFKVQLHTLFQTEIESIHQLLKSPYSQVWVNENQRMLSRCHHD